MDKILTKAKHLRGELVVPGDKSISHRAVMIAALAEGTSEITGFLAAADPLSTIACFKALGVEYEISNDIVRVHGKGLLGLREPASMLNAGNSGTTIRLISGILAGQKFPTRISGDEYLVKRPMKRIIEPLMKMGARISSTEKFTAPLAISPVAKLNAIRYELPIASAQIKSAVLLAGLYAEGTTCVVETEQSRDHTERMLGLQSKKIDGKNCITVEGGMKLRSTQFAVPGDPSSAAFFIVAGLIVPHSEILIKNVGLNPTRIGFLSVLKKMGGQIEILDEKIVGGEPIGNILVKSSSLTTDFVVEGEIIPNIIDEIPILAIAAVFAKGKIIFKNAADLRNKECDRIKAVCNNFSLMGIETEESPDGFAFESKIDVHTSEFNSFGDHRIAMSFGIASLALDGESKILDAGCVDISFPTFWQTLQILIQ